MPALPSQQLKGHDNFAAVARWNSQNYSGFYFDPVKSLGDETLILFDVQGRRVPSPIQSAISSGSNRLGQEGFQYITSLQPRRVSNSTPGEIISS